MSNYSCLKAPLYLTGELDTVDKRPTKALSESIIIPLTLETGNKRPITAVFQSTIVPF